MGSVSYGDSSKGNEGEGVMEFKEMV